MTDPNITWRRTFPECEPGTDGVAIFEGRVMGRVRLLAELLRRSEALAVDVTDPDPRRRAGRARRRNALAQAGQLDRLIERWHELRAFRRIAFRAPQPALAAGMLRRHLPTG